MWGIAGTVATFLDGRLVMWRLYILLGPLTFLLTTRWRRWWDDTVDW